MARGRMFLMAVPALALLLTPVAASAKGGGAGGVCYQDPVVIDPDPDAVMILDSCFSPDTVTVTTGDVIRWTSQAQMAHNIVIEGGPASGTLEPFKDAAFAVRFNKPGTFVYSCTFHPGMDGRVAVEGEPQLGATFNVVSARDASTKTEILDAAVPIGAASAETVLHVRIGPGTALILLLVALTFGLGAGAGVRMARR